MREGWQRGMGDGKREIEENEKRERGEQGCRIFLSFSVCASCSTRGEPLEADHPSTNHQAYRSECEVRSPRSEERICFIQ